MGLCPVPAMADLDLHRDRHLQGVFHLLFHKGSDSGQLVYRKFYKQFVMDLQDHPGLEIFTAKTFVNIDHRNLDNIRRRPLDR